MTEITKPCANFCKYKYSLMFYLLASLFMDTTQYNWCRCKQYLGRIILVRLLSAQCINVVKKNCNLIYEISHNKMFKEYKYVLEVRNFI